MKELTIIENRICETQAELYEYAANEQFIFPDFSDIYLKSDFCRRAMDTDYSRFQLQCPGELLDFIIPENPGIDKKYADTEQFDDAVAYWIGYMYRYLATAINTSSKDILKRWDFLKMCNMYPGLHTVDYRMAAEMIFGEKSA